MKRKPRSRLPFMAIVGALLFLIVNFISSEDDELTGKDSFAGLTAPQISKEEASEKAEQFVQQRTGLLPSTTYPVYETQKTLEGYLQKNDLFTHYMRAFNGKYPLEFYRVNVRSAKKSGQAQDTEWTVDVHPQNGQIAGWKASVDRTSAQRQSSSAGNHYASGEGQFSDRALDEAASRAFLTQAGLDAKQYRLLPKSRSGNGEYVFQHQSEKVGKAPLQAHLWIEGGQIAGLRQSFAVPEDELLWQHKQNALAGRMSFISLSLTVVMAFAAIGITWKRRREISLRAGIALTVVCLALQLIENINFSPAGRIVDGEFISDQAAAIWGAVIMLFAVLAGIQVYVSLVSGRWLSGQIGKDLWPQWQEADFGRRIVSAMKQGYLVCLFLLGVQSLILFIAENRFNAWAVNDPSFSLQNMIWPQIFPATAWTAAITEEAIYRWFGVLLCLVWFKRALPAVLLPSMIWALSHTAYPVYPAYTRFVEVTIIGIILGYVFLKFGFFTALFAHASMNSLLMGLSLIVYLSTAQGWLSGLAFMASPAIVAYAVAYWHGKRRGKPFNPPHPEALQ